MKNIKLHKNLDALINEYKNSDMQLFILVAEYSDFNFDKLLQTGINFHGAIVPEVIYEENNYNNFIITAEIVSGSTIDLIEDIGNFSIEKTKFQDKNSFTIILDGLSSNITYFLETIFKILPEESQLIGSGAGKMTLKQEPVIFSRRGIFQNAALIVSHKNEIKVGVENGWEYLEGPFLVSSSNKNILKSLNFKNAFDVYKNIVEKDSGLTFTDDNFFDIAKSYPLGIVKFNKEIVVRYPIALDENNNLILVGDIEQNATINILKGEKSRLIASAKTAIVKVLNKTDKDFENVLVFDCISRSIFLKDEYKQEILNIKNEIPDKKLFGALTLGEISNSGNEYINFYNKTCVVGVLC